MELTSEEKKILSGISFDAEGIESGELNEADEKLLMEMRATLAYLKEKYPEYNFEITGCEPKSGTARDYDEWYYKALEIVRESAFIAMAVEKDGQIEIRDDFYGEIIREEVTDKIRSILGPSIPVVKIDVSFWEYLGKEYSGELNADKVLKGKISAGNDIKIFLDGSGILGTEYENVVKKIEESFKKAGVIGDVYVVILKDKDSDFTKDRLYSESIYI
ncbi:hypothetical protein [Butyrivibrio sp. YAB3001]|uniref:hypothetical protein n=1 Tax=Butyrivibrio sp. YAB3001 TaxID=1520812 RepID=UPI0008F62353|nr:hypothetical protein [Butyrivibrio sp. YAB3001]SFC22016.1 hypothetical protein SAMN02910398_01783 [Butyrivibrio sp. YAB3001]